MYVHTHSEMNIKTAPQKTICIFLIPGPGKGKQQFHRACVICVAKCTSITHITIVSCLDKLPDQTTINTVSHDLLYTMTQIIVPVPPCLIGHFLWNTDSAHTFTSKKKPIVETQLLFALWRADFKGLFNAARVSPVRLFAIRSLRANRVLATQDNQYSSVNTS